MAPPFPNVDLPSRAAVNRAGKAFLEADDLSVREMALETIQQWRRGHTAPLFVVYQTLKNRAKKIDDTAVVSSRMKRMPSIRAKLRRGEVRKLGEMQDFAGCRAVVGTIDDVRKLQSTYNSKRTQYEVTRTSDYIEGPKVDGYRGVHLVVRFRTETSHERLMVEVQLRTWLMHQWSTAVEVVDTFTDSRMKVGEESEGWSEFFLLASALIALEERMPLPPGVPQERSSILCRLRNIGASELIQQLDGFKTAIASSPISGEDRYFVVTLDAAVRSTVIKGFTRKESDAALAEYARQEEAVSDRPDMNVVLVDLDSSKSLERAYPNYFADTSSFISFMREQLGNFPV